MSQSAFKKYLISTTNFGPGDITTGSVVDTAGGSFGGGTITINYFKVGKLYYGFFVNPPSQSVCIGTNGGAGPLATTIARIATLLGITVAASYSSGIGSTLTTRVVWYTAGPNFWDFADNGTNVQQLYAILAN